MSAFATLLALAALAGALLGWLGLRRAAGPLAPGRWADVCLVTFALALAGARAAYVLQHPAIFSTAFDEALDPRRGGLDWVGALAGGLAGALLAARWRRLPPAAVLGALTPVLPLLALAGWTACAGARCGAGAEIPTLAGISPLAAAELPDVFGIVAPRWNTPLWGQALALAALLLWGMCAWRGWLPRARFWLVLALLAAGMTLIGLFRA